MKKLVAFVLLGMCCFVLTTQAWAEGVTRQLPFNTQVTLIVPKAYLFKFELCADSACADVAYAETKKIKLKTATLSFNLGAGTVDPTSPAFIEVDFSQQYWLRISHSTNTGFVAIGPPSKLSVVPYALWSNQVEGVGTGVGTITGVYGGNGLSGSGTSGAVTLNVGAGSGIAVGGDTVSIASGGVTSAHIQDGAVTGWDIADNSVTGADIANGALTGPDIATGSLTGTNIQDGTVAAVDVGFNFAGSSSKGGPAVDSDLVDGLHANRLRPVLATSTSGATTFIQSTCTNYTNGSVTITVPTSGVVVVEFDVWVAVNHINGIRDFGYLMVGTSASDCGSLNSYRGIFEVPAGYGTYSYLYISVHVTRPISVAAGTYTYYLNGYMSSGYTPAPANDAFVAANMKAVFYPN